MHHFFTAIKEVLNELKDIIPAATFVIVSIIGSYKYIKYKLTH